MQPAFTFRESARNREIKREEKKERKAWEPRL